MNTWAIHLVESLVEQVLGDLVDACRWRYYGEDLTRIGARKRWTGRAGRRVASDIRRASEFLSKTLDRLCGGSSTVYRSDEREEGERKQLIAKAKAELTAMYISSAAAGRRHL